jgi:hypothetical protein
MIGAKYYLDRSRYHSQENNAIETLIPGLEYCGPTAAINCVASLLDKYEFSVGGWNNPPPQPEDLLTLFFIEHENWDEFNDIRPLNLDKIPPNRVPQYYPLAVTTLYPEIECEFIWFPDLGKDPWDYIINKIESSTFQLCEPGHYVCAHGFDPDMGVLLKKDSWLSRFKDHDGFNKPITYDAFNQCDPFLIEYRRKA